MNGNIPKFYSIQDILIASSIVANELSLTNHFPVNSAHNESENGKPEKIDEKPSEENDKKQKPSEENDKIEKPSEENDKIEKPSEDNDKIEKPSEENDKIEKPSVDNDITDASKKTNAALRCDRCSRCSKANCGVCFGCKDMPQFGGQNKLKQDCIQRHCIFFVFDPPKVPKVSTETVSNLIDDKEEEIEKESDTLEEIFNTPDSDPIIKPPDNTSKTEDDSEADLSQTEFINLVFSLKGLVSMLEQECSVEEDKVRVLDSFCCRPSHPVYDIFNIINLAFSTGNIEFLQSTGVWMEEAVKAVGRLLQVNVVHTFLRDTTDICHEFINFCLQSLAQCPVELRDNLCLLMSYLAGHKTLGKLLVNGILDMLSAIAHQLREAANFMCADEESMEVFDNLMGLILQVWPKYVSQLVRLPDPADQVPKSKRRASAASKEKKPEFVRPKLLFTEAAQLRQEIIGWRELLDSCTVSLSITHTHFCEGIWKIDQLCEVLLNKL